jgi:hypothetical protein
VAAVREPIRQDRVCPDAGEFSTEVAADRSTARAKRPSVARKSHAVRSSKKASVSTRSRPRGRGRIQHRSCGRALTARARRPSVAGKSHAVRSSKRPACSQDRVRADAGSSGARRSPAARNRGTISRHGVAARNRGTESRHGVAARNRGTESRHAIAERNRGTQSRNGIAARNRGTESRQSVQAWIDRRVAGALAYPSNNVRTPDIHRSIVPPSILLLAAFRSILLLSIFGP